MSDPVHARLTRKKRTREYNARGRIYAWLRAHHADVARCRHVERRPWAVLILEMVADGVRREDGKEPVVKNVARVWERVCRDIEADAKVVKPTRRYPSDRSPNWRPEVVPQLSSVAQQPGAAYQPVVAPPPIRSPLRSAGTSLQTSPANPAVQVDDPDMTPEVRAELDRALERLGASDRRKFGW